MDQVASLQRELPASDRTRLGEYLDDVREIERRIQKAENQIPADLKLPEAPVGVPESFDEHFKLMYDLQVLAFRAEITRIASSCMPATPAERFILKAEFATDSRWPRITPTIARTWTSSR